MGDRNNLIKFGPEWLRNLSREPSASGSGPNNQTNPPRTNTSAPMVGQNYGTVASLTSGTSASHNSGSGVSAAAGQTRSTSPVAPFSSGGATTGARGGSPIPGPSSGIPRNRSNNPPKILLARLRYGREEMLALYDRHLESPEELKHFDTLYQSRTKQPFALNNTYDEDVRDNARSWPPVGAIPIPERYSSSRGSRGSNTSEARGRSRMPFVRQTMLGGRRQNNNTNWRQPHVRDENEEWRFTETQRNRQSVDKWDREWGERPNLERQQSWTSNRRTWVGNETLNNEENLPEWAVDNTEAGAAGTFDSSGAFHGFSNDDSNLSKSQETSFPLTRSQTHGSFSRSKTAEEVLGEWWESGKAKKLSGKKFDSAESKFVKAGSSGSVEGINSASKPSMGREDEGYNEIYEREEKIDPLESPEGKDSNGEDANQSNIYTDQFQKSKAFEAFMRSDIELDNTNNERGGNFQSVMITHNHGLRQKHQNLVPCPVDSTGKQYLNTELLQMLHAMPPMNPAPDNENREKPDENLVEKFLDMTLEDPKLQNPMMAPMHPNINPGMPNQMANNLQFQIANQVLLNHGMPVTGASSLQMTNIQGRMQPMHNVGVPNQMNPPIQNVGMHNSALNSSLGLSIGTPNNNLVMPMQGVPPPVIPNPEIQARLGFQPSGRMPIMPGTNVGNTSMFLGQNNRPLIQSNEIPMPNATPQNNMYLMHTLQHSQDSQGPFSSMYNLPQATTTPMNSDSNLVDTWYYEDPEKVIQGPFSSKEMYTWYQAGFFNPSLMVRRACESHMRPLASYGPVVPFIQLDMPPTTYPMPTPFNRHLQHGMGVDDSLWGPPVPSTDMLWLQPVLSHNEPHVNNLPVFWDFQAGSVVSANVILPEEIAKEMKTEDQILAQLRASQNSAPQATPFMNDQPPTSTANDPVTFTLPEENFHNVVRATPDLDVLQKLIQPETMCPPSAFSQPDPEPDKKTESQEIKVPKAQEIKEESALKEPVPPAPVPAPVPEPAPKQQQPQRKVSPELKLPKQAKNDGEKVVNKIKENNNAKNKNKKTKEEKKDEVPETKTKADDVPVKAEKRSVESSPTKSKKEEKQNKKEQEKEKKELVKNGFTIVKGVDKTIKENKKKTEEAKAVAAAAEEAERKKKKEEETTLEEEKKRKIADAIKKAQDQQQQRHESIAKKAPWSSLTAQSVAGNPEQGLTLTEIQRLEREKKAEQLKEQQQMMKMIAQQQAAAMAREQEKQAKGWAKKKSSKVKVKGQRGAVNQAESRKAAAAVAAAAATATAAAAKALDECLAAATAPAPAPAHTVPWASSQNGGFWETQNTVASKSDKAPETTKPTDFIKPKKKVTLSTTKKDTSPVVEFEAWCTSILTPWNSKIDVPTFIGFLKDIESPYEVKDYVKCYLGETKDSSDFARQFLERRSKLLRVGMVTPSDDLCSPALAITPRNTNLGDYQEVKGKGKKTKKNKMLKVDARILGFSVTASEDRINVGDIDTV